MTSLISSLFSGRQTPGENDDSDSSPKKRDDSPASGLLPLRQMLPGASPTAAAAEKTQNPGSDAIFNDASKEPPAEVTAPLSDLPEALPIATNASPSRKRTQLAAAKKASPSPVARKPRKKDEGGEGGESEFSFRRFTNHRWSDDDILEIQVEWDVGEPTWETEINMHRDAPQALLAYWRKQGGRPPNPKDPGLYDIFAILDHSKDKKKLLVQWVGFSKKEATWEPTKVVEETADDVVKEYWAAQGRKG